jgi:hypothetical protein
MTPGPDVWVKTSDQILASIENDGSIVSIRLGNQRAAAAVRRREHHPAALADRRPIYCMFQGSP